MVLLSCVLLVSPALLVTLYWRGPRSQGRTDVRPIFATVVTERVGLVIAVWVAAFFHSPWVLAGVVPFLIATRLTLRHLGKNAERSQQLPA